MVRWLVEHKDVIAVMALIGVAMLARQIFGQ